MNELKVGAIVRKIKGYQWPGVVVAVFQTTRDQTRVVVECTVPGVEGALHIYAPEQVEEITEEVIHRLIHEIAAEENDHE